jgi:hypothetical protein
MSMTARPGDQPRRNNGATMGNDPATSGFTAAEAMLLNAEALRALWGLARNGNESIARLLESGAPINDLVRLELVDALRGKSSGGVSISLDGHDAQASRVEALQIRRQWYADGLRAKPYRDKHGVVDGFLIAAENNGHDDTYWKKRYYYAKNCDDWTEAAKLQGGMFANIGEAALRDIWHWSAISAGGWKKPSPPTVQDYERNLLQRIHHIKPYLQAEFPNLPDADINDIVVQMLSLWELRPPETA